MKKNIYPLLFFASFFLQNALANQYPTGIWGEGYGDVARCVTSSLAGSSACLLADHGLDPAKHRFDPYPGSKDAYILMYQRNDGTWDQHPMHLIIEQYYTGKSPDDCAKADSFLLPSGDTDFPDPQPGQPIYLGKYRCKNECMYESGISASAPDGFDEFAPTGDYCHVNQQDDKITIGQPPPTTVWRRCPSGKGMYQVGKPMSEKCAAKPPDEPQNPKDPKEPAPDNPPTDPPTEPPETGGCLKM